MPFNKLIRKLKALTIGLGASSHTRKMDSIFSIVSCTYPKFVFDVKNYTQYAIDILITLFEDEKKTRIDFKCNSQIYLREIVIERILAYAKYKKYAMSTVHLAVLYMDIHMSRYILSENLEHLKFTSYVACLLAAKTNEVDDEIPSIKDLITHGQVDLTEELGVDFRNRSAYSAEQVKIAFKQYAKIYANLEFVIFESLQFSLTRPTVISFLDIFQKLCIKDEDLDDIHDTHYKYESIGDLKVYAIEYIKLLSKFVLHRPDFYQFSPSKIAAAIVASTRKFIGIKSFWNVELEFFTRSSIEDIEPILAVFTDLQHSMGEYANENVDNVSVHHQQQHPFSNDSGFYSCSESSVSLSSSKV